MSTTAYLMNLSKLKHLDQYTKAIGAERIIRSKAIHEKMFREIDIVIIKILKEISQTALYGTQFQVLLNSIKEVDKRIALEGESVINCHTTSDIHNLVKYRISDTHKLIKLVQQKDLNSNQKEKAIAVLRRRGMMK